jgi:hypothetical protein
MLKLFQQLKTIKGVLLSTKKTPSSVFPHDQSSRLSIEPIISPPNRLAGARCSRSPEPLEQTIASAHACLLTAVHKARRRILAFVCLLLLPVKHDALFRHSCKMKDRSVNLSDHQRAMDKIYYVLFSPLIFMVKHSCLKISATDGNFLFWIILTSVAELSIRTPFLFASFDSSTSFLALIGLRNQLHGSFSNCAFLAIWEL